MNDVRRIATSIDFGIRADELNAQEVTKVLGLTPTRAFQRGDKYLGKQRIAGVIKEAERTRPHGVWHFCTSEFIRSDSVKDHASFLLRKIEPSEARIKDFIRNPDFFVKLSIWYVGSGGFGIPAPLLARLARLCEEVAVTCWDDDNDPQ